MKPILAAAVTGLAAFVSTGAMATDGFYYGLSAGYSSANSGAGDTFGPESSGDKFSTLGATLGYRASSGSVFYGGEATFDFAMGADLTDDVSGNVCTAGAFGPYYCTVDSTVRLRGVMGGSMSADSEWFVSAGFVRVEGSSATNSFTQESNANTGYTFGLGMQKEMGTGMLRGELIYDQADNSGSVTGGYDPDYRAVSLRVTYLFGH